MTSKQDIIQEMITRKQDILSHLERLRDEVHVFEETHIQKPIEAIKVDNTLWLEKANLLKDIDVLKIQNQLLTQRLQEGETKMAENNILISQLNASRLEISQKNLEISEYQKRNSDLESTIQELKDELAKIRKTQVPVESNSNTRKIDASDRIAMINQQQSLISEIERMKSEYEKYKDLIASIESVASTGKICLVSSRGLKVTTMLELAQEIKNFK